MKFKSLKPDTILEKGDYLFADANNRTAMGTSLGGEPAIYAGSSMEEEDIVGYCRIVVDYGESANDLA